MRSIVGALAFSLLGQMAGAQCSTDFVDLRGEWGEARFRIEIADSAEERSLGLMHRESLPMGGGMLFVYDEPRSVSFWMKNTLIPLDMIFLKENGVIHAIHHLAQPLDETPVFGGDEIQYVLEINGGLARTIGLKAGDMLRHPVLDQGLASWSCEKE